MKVRCMTLGTSLLPCLEITKTMVGTLQSYCKDFSDSRRRYTEKKLPWHIGDDKKVVVAVLGEKTS